MEAAPPRKRCQTEGVVLCVLVDRGREEPLLKAMRNVPLPEGVSVFDVPLHVGDVVLVRRTRVDGENLGRALGEDEEPLLVIERKTGEDLAASLMDGRYAEQKARLLGVGPSKVVLLLEGWKPRAPVVGRRPAWIIMCAMINSMLRDGFHGWSTADTADSAAWILLVAKQFAGGKLDGPRAAAQAPRWAATLKAKKGSNWDHATTFEMQLCAIPGVSHAQAHPIVERYGSMVKLCAELEGCESTIANLTYPSVTRRGETKRRRVGPSSARKVRAHLAGHDVATPLEADPDEPDEADEE